MCLPSDVSHNTYRLTWVSLTLDMGSWLLQQSTAADPYLGQGISPHCCTSDFECGVAPLGPPVPLQPATDPYLYYRLIGEWKEREN